MPTEPILDPLERRARAPGSRYGDAPAKAGPGRAPVGLGGLTS